MKKTQRRGIGIFAAVCFALSLNACGTPGGGAMAGAKTQENSMGSYEEMETPEENAGEEAETRKASRSRRSGDGENSSRDRRDSRQEGGEEDGDSHREGRGNRRQPENSTQSRRDALEKEGLTKRTSTAAGTRHKSSESSNSLPKGTEGFIFPDSASRELSSSEIQSASLWQLRRGVNEIYARHGRKFTNGGQAAYFASQSWYRGTVEASNFKESVLNEYERKNVAALEKRLEKLTGGMDISSLEKKAAKFLGSTGVNGLLRSRFNQNSLENVSIVDIVYQMQDESVSYEQLENEITAGGEEIYGDLSYARRATVDQFLRTYLGYGLDEKNWNMEDVGYVDSMGVFYFDHGDSNYYRIEYVELMGMGQDTYWFWYLPREDEFNGETGCQIELKKQGDSFRVLSVQDAG